MISFKKSRNADNLTKKYFEMQSWHSLAYENISIKW